MIDVNRLKSSLLLENVSVENDFVWVKQFDGSLLRSLNVEGLGDIQIPFKVEDVEKLKDLSELAPYGKGLNVVVDSNMNHAWQLTATKIIAAVPESFFTTTITEMTSQALSHLQLDWLIEGDEDNDNRVEVFLQKMLVYDTGGHYRRTRDYEFEEGVCGTIVLQIPVENGFQGGRLKVEQDTFVNQYECSDNNDCLFLAAFRSNCQHELDTIKSGWRVTLVFNLVWKSAIDSTKIPLPFPCVLEKMIEVRKALEPWFRTNPDEMSKTNNKRISFHNDSCFSGTSAEDDKLIVDEQEYTCENNSTPKGNRKGIELTNIDRLCQEPLQELVTLWDSNSLSNIHLNEECQINVNDTLVFVLRHEYDMVEINFSKLKGDDLQLARLLMCATFLDVHLAQMTTNVPEGIKEDAGREDDTYCFELNYWINARNIAVPFKGIKLNRDTQFVNIFQSNCKSNIQGARQKSDGNVQHYANNSRQAFLVVWPKKDSFLRYCTFAFDAVLDKVEANLQTRSLQKKIETLCKIITYCRANPYKVFGDPTVTPGIRSSRILRLCVLLNARQEGLDFLKLLATNFCHFDRGKKVIFYEGIRSHEVAQLIAQFECQISGWDSCAELLYNMISPIRLASQMNYIISMARHLMENCCIVGAKKILDCVAFYLPKMELVVSMPCLEEPLIDFYINFVIDCEADPTLASTQRIRCTMSLFPRLEPYQQCRLIVGLRRKIRFGGIPSCLQMYQEMCRVITSTNLIACPSISNIIVPLVDCFFQLGDPELVHLLTKTICGDSSIAQRDPLVDVLLSSADFWSLAVISDLGKSTLSNLIEAYINAFCHTSRAENEIYESEQKELIDCRLGKAVVLLENLADHQLHLRKISELIRNNRIILTEALIKRWGQILNYETTSINPDSRQCNLLFFFKSFIRTEKRHYSSTGQYVEVDFSPLLMNMSFERICRIILDLFEDESEFPSRGDLEMVPSCLRLYQQLYWHCTIKDIVPFLAPDEQLLLTLVKCYFWLGDEPSLQYFVHKICTFVPLEKENLMVKAIVSCCGLWPLAIASPISLTSFYCFLERRIDYLKLVEEPVYSLEIPDAHVPSYPEIEAFLRSSQEKMVYNNLASIFHARNFAYTLTKMCRLQGWYGVKFEPMGTARNAYCEVVKTKAIYQIKIQHYKSVQKELAEIISLRQNFEARAREIEDGAQAKYDCASTSDGCTLYPLSPSRSTQKTAMIIDISD